MAGNVQPTLEWARPLCWVIRAAGSLKSGLALTPGSDPESASSFLRGLRLGGLVTLFVARGGPRRGIGGGPVHHAGQARLLHSLRLTLLRAVHCTPSGVRVCACLRPPNLPLGGGSVYVIEIGSNPEIGTNPVQTKIDPIHLVV